MNLRNFFFFFCKLSKVFTEGLYLIYFNKKQKIHTKTNETLTQYKTTMLYTTTRKRKHKSQRKKTTKKHQTKPHLFLISSSPGSNGKATLLSFIAYFELVMTMCTSSERGLHFPSKILLFFHSEQPLTTS